MPAAVVGPLTDSQEAAAQRLMRAPFTEWPTGMKDEVYTGIIKNEWHEFVCGEIVLEAIRLWVTRNPKLAGS